MCVIVLVFYFLFFFCIETMNGVTDHKNKINIKPTKTLHIEQQHRRRQLEQTVTSRIRHLKDVRINKEHNQHSLQLSWFFFTFKTTIFNNGVHYVDNGAIMINYYSFLIIRCLLFIIIQISDSSRNILDLIQSFSPIDNGLVSSSCRADNGITMFDIAFVSIVQESIVEEPVNTQQSLSSLMLFLNVL